MFEKRIQKATSKLELQSALKQLYADLNGLGAMPYNTEVKEVYDMYIGAKRRLAVPKDMALYDYAIKFFNIIAKFQDSDVMKEGLLSDRKSFEELSMHIKNSGRNPYGWVRAERGQPVTVDNVFLGNVCGLWTKSIKTFKEVADDEWLQWVIQEYQLRIFLESHVEPMKKLLANIIMTEQKAKTGIVDSIFDNYVRGRRR